MATSSDPLGDSTPLEASAEIEAIFNQTPSDENDNTEFQASDILECRCEADNTTELDDRESCGIFKPVEVDRSIESTSEPLEDDVSKPYRPTWCFDATLQQAGFYVDGYGIIPDPITTAEKLHKPKAFPRSCALEAAEERNSIRLRQVLRGGNMQTGESSGIVEASVASAQAPDVSKGEKVSRNYNITGIGLVSGAFVVSVMAFVAGYAFGLAG